MCMTISSVLTYTARWSNWLYRYSITHLGEHWKITNVEKAAKWYNIRSRYKHHHSRELTHHVDVPCSYRTKMIFISWTCPTPNRQTSVIDHLRAGLFDNNRNPTFDVYFCYISEYQKMYIAISSQGEASLMPTPASGRGGVHKQVEITALLI